MVCPIQPGDIQIGSHVELQERQEKDGSSEVASTIPSVLPSGWDDSFDTALLYGWVRINLYKLSFREGHSRVQSGGQSNIDRALDVVALFSLALFLALFLALVLDHCYRDAPYSLLSRGVKWLDSMTSNQPIKR